MLRWRKDAGAHDLLFGANYGFSTVNGGNYQNIGGERGALMWTTDDDASSLELFALDRWSLRTALDAGLRHAVRLRGSRRGRLQGAATTPSIRASA